MAKPYVLVIGGTGKTGVSILSGLLADGRYRVGVLVRAESLQKPQTLEVIAKGVEIVTGDISKPEEINLSGVDILVSAVHFSQLLSQIPLIKIAKAAGVKRFIPCDWGTASLPEGEMVLREVKEKVRQATKDAQIPYTFIDVGWWYEISLPTNGPLDFRFGNGDVKTALTSKSDIGKFVARILSDERTIGKYVFIWGEEYSQDEIVKIANTYSKTEVKFSKQLSEEETRKKIAELRTKFSEKKGKNSNLDEGDFELLILEYGFNKYVTGHNTVENAKKLLGALDARELYPDVKPKPFHEFVKEHFANLESGNKEAIMW